ncbi:MAG: lipopolysaccharide biosynthesis protein [Bacteroidaceae bacterium]
MTLQQQAFSGVFWSAVERFSVQGGQIIIEIVLARLLLPSDYGVVAMLGVFISVAQAFVDGGLSNALIQKSNRTVEDYSTALYFNIGVSVLAYGALYAASPLIADFYQMPSLSLYAKVIGLIIVIGAFSVVQRAKLMIELQFKKQAFISGMSILISGICSIVMAYRGFGIWALIAQLLLNSLFITLLSWVVTKWKPQWVFSMDSFRSLFSYGVKLLSANLLQIIYLNLYTIAIGKKFSAQQLGFFNRSYILAQVPSYKLNEIMNNAIFPIQCKIQHDEEKLRQSFVQYLRMSCFIIFPLTLGLCALAEPVVRVVLTDKWLPSVPLLQILCIAFVWTPVMAANYIILKVKGQMTYFLKAEIYKKIVGVTILIVSLFYGLKVICLGLIVYSILDIFIITRYSGPSIRCGLRSQAKELLPIVLLGFSMAAVVYSVQMLLDSLWMKLFVGLLAGVVYYVGLACLCRMREYRILYDKFVRRKG